MFYVPFDFIYTNFTILQNIKIVDYLAPEIMISYYINIFMYKIMCQNSEHITHTIIANYFIAANVIYNIISIKMGCISSVTTENLQINLY